MARQGASHKQTPRGLCEPWERIEEQRQEAEVCGGLCGPWDRTEAQRQAGTSGLVKRRAGTSGLVEGRAVTGTSGLVEGRAVTGTSGLVKRWVEASRLCGPCVSDQKGDSRR